MRNFCKIFGHPTQGQVLVQLAESEDGTKPAVEYTYQFEGNFLSSVIVVGSPEEQTSCFEGMTEEVICALVDDGVARLS